MYKRQLFLPYAAIDQGADRADGDTAAARDTRRCLERLIAVGGDFRLEPAPRERQNGALVQLGACADAFAAEDTLALVAENVRARRVGKARFFAASPRTVMRSECHAVLVGVFLQ